MHTLLQRASLTAFLVTILFSAPAVFAQSSGSILGTVTDPTGAVIPNAAISISNPVSGLSRHTTSDGAGHFQFTNLPPNPYHLTISAHSFTTISQDADVRSTIPVTINVTLTPGATSTTVEVTTTAGDLIENDPVGHTDVDRSLFQKMPLESESSSLSSLVTLASPGIAADSNGLFHGLGDHASNSFSIDSQPVTDQQSKVFSNQLPSNSVQSMEVVDGAPPAEYGGKTSVVIVVTTRSGQGVTTPTGSVTTSYGTFGSSTAAVDLAYGGKSWGNFIELDGLDTGRFLDPPEFAVFHDKGNEFNVFDRIDRQITTADSVHFDLGVSRSWFQTPNSYDNLNVQNIVSGGAGANPVYGSVGNTDQRSKIDTFNIAPTYTHTISVHSVFNFTGYVRRDAYNYYPSGNPLADLGPPSLQNQTIGQARSLTNAGTHTDLTYVKGVNNIKVGVEYDQTFLRELDTLAIVSPTFNSPCVDANGNALPGFSGTNPNECANAGEFSNYSANNPLGTFNPILLPYDLTRGGGDYTFNGHTDVKELGLYVEDQITAGNWTISPGIRGDLYNGLAIQRQAEPRMGISYNVKKTNTVLRTSYARTLESPFNENLVLSSQGCGNQVLAPLLSCTPGVATTLEPGFRNEFHAGLQQAAGKHFVLSGDYIWKYTHNAFDFSVLGNTPITFPIDWRSSKIPGFDLRADITTFHGFSAFVVMSSVAARFYPPQVAGAGATVAQGVVYPFRIDHDEKYNQTTHFQYQIPGKFSPWFSFNWRFDSGLVAGSSPCYDVANANSACPNSSLAPNGNPAVLNGQPAIVLVDNNIPAGTNPVTGGLAYLPLSADQEFQGGFSCDGVRATGHNLIGTNIPGTPYYECQAAQFTSSLISIPATGTGTNDHNPPRITQRDVFDASLGQDNLFNGDKYKWSLHLTAVNFTNKYALYNYLSTFSGTHYLTPRTLTAELGFHF